LNEIYWETVQKLVARSQGFQLIRCGVNTELTFLNFGAKRPLDKVDQSVLSLLLVLFHY